MQCNNRELNPCQTAENSKHQMVVCLHLVVRLNQASMIIFKWTKPAMLVYSGLHSWLLKCRPSFQCYAQIYMTTPCREVQQGCDGHMVDWGVWGWGNQWFGDIMAWETAMYIVGISPFCLVIYSLHVILCSSLLDRDHHELWTMASMASTVLKHQPDPGGAFAKGFPSPGRCQISLPPLDGAYGGWSPAS